MSLRENIGYEDGNWGLVAGHVESGESALEAMIKETKEEAGLILNKCGGLKFFPLDNIPTNSVEYIREAVKLVSKGESYSEKGWS